MEQTVKIGFIRGYDQFFVQTDNPMERPRLQDFEGDDVGYLTEMKVWETAEKNRKRYAVIDSHQKIAKKFIEQSVKFELIRVDNLYKAKILGKQK